MKLSRISQMKKHKIYKLLFSTIVLYTNFFLKHKCKISKSFGKMGKTAETILLQRKSFGKVLGKFLKFWEKRGPQPCNLFFNNFYL